MHVLVTNDDGVTEPGLRALANAMRDFGKVTILGPDRNWPGGGHVKTLHRPLRVREVRYVSITPLHLDLTEYRRAEQLNQWRWQAAKAASDNGRYSPALMALHL